MLKTNEQVILGVIEAIKTFGQDHPLILLRKTLPYLSEEEALYWLDWYGLKK